MRTRPLFLSAGAGFLYLLTVNALFFPLVFPDGPPVRYSNPRAVDMPHYHLLAFLITALLMAYIYPMLDRGGPVWKEGLRTGIILALFVSLPMGLHEYAMTDVSFLAQVFPALWVTATWGVAGIVIGAAYRKTERHD